MIPEEIGTLEILNCGMGDLEIKFTEGVQEEIDKAKRCIEDMLKRGYALFIREASGELTRIRAFDAAQNCYIVRDTPPEEERVKKSRIKRVPMKGRKVLAVGRSAGG